MKQLTIILWTTRVPDPLGSELQAAGFNIWEATEFAEVTRLLETVEADVVVFKAEVEGERVANLKTEVMTIRLRPNATASELVRELWQLFPGRGLVE